MATSFEAMGSAIYGRLAPSLGSAVYDTIAPGTVATEYVVFQRLTEIDDYSFGNNRMESLEYLIKAVSDDDWPHTAYARYGVAHDAIQDAPLTVGGYGLMRFRRTSTINYMDNERFHHVGGVYRCDLNKT